VERRGRGKGEGGSGLCCSGIEERCATSARRIRRLRSERGGGVGGRPERYQLTIQRSVDSWTPSSPPDFLLGFVDCGLPACPCRLACPLHAYAHFLPFRPPCSSLCVAASAQLVPPHCFVLRSFIFGRYRRVSGCEYSTIEYRYCATGYNDKQVVLRGFIRYF